jgi:hypothetical protein
MFVSGCAAKQMLLNAYITLLEAPQELLPHAGQSFGHLPEGANFPHDGTMQ